MSKKEIKKKKIFRVSIFEINECELDIEAYDDKDAVKKAQKMIDGEPDFFGYQIYEVTEI